MFVRGVGLGFLVRFLRRCCSFACAFLRKAVKKPGFARVVVNVEGFGGRVVVNAEEFSLIRLRAVNFVLGLTSPKRVLTISFHAIRPASPLAISASC